VGPDNSAGSVIPESPEGPAARATSADPAEGLRAVAALRRLADKLEILQVRRARALGWSWQDIAAQLGVTRQTVHKKHAGRQGGD
jgi:DNA-binding NarL/FixJ family response regulator